MVDGAGGGERLEHLAHLRGGDLVRGDQVLVDAGVEFAHCVRKAGMVARLYAGFVGAHAWKTKSGSFEVCTCL